MTTACPRHWQGSNPGLPLYESQIVPLSYHDSSIKTARTKEGSILLVDTELTRLLCAGAQQVPVVVLALTHHRDVYFKLAGLFKTHMIAGLMRANQILRLRKFKLER